MQDVTGISHLNSLIKIYIRIKNLDKISIEDDNVTVSGPLFIGSVNVGTTLTNHGTAISMIQGNISTMNSDISTINSDISTINSDKSAINTDVSS